MDIFLFRVLLWYGILKKYNHNFILVINDTHVNTINFRVIYKWTKTLHLIYNYKISVEIGYNTLYKLNWSLCKYIQCLLRILLLKLAVTHINYEIQQRQCIKKQGRQIQKLIAK